MGPSGSSCAGTKGAGLSGCGVWDMVALLCFAHVLDQRCSAHGAWVGRLRAFPHAERKRFWIGRRGVDRCCKEGVGACAGFHSLVKSVDICNASPRFLLFVASNDYNIMHTVIQ